MAIENSFLELRGLHENMNRQSRTRPGRPSVFDRPVIGLGDSVRHVGALSGPGGHHSNPNMRSRSQILTLGGISIPITAPKRAWPTRP